MGTGLVRATLLVAMALGTAGAAAGADEPLAVEVGPEQPAGWPIVVTLRVTNRGRAPMVYWCGGPGLYPGADCFRSIVEGAPGSRTTTALSNGQAIMGSGRHLEVAAGVSISFPAVLDPLPAGSYRLRVCGDAFGEWPALPTSAAVPFAVVDDPNRADRFAREILERVRADDPFAAHVATKYALAPVVAALTEDLESDDAVAAERAGSTLWKLDPVPPGLAAPVARALERRLAAKAVGPLSWLTIMAGRLGTDEVLDPLLAVCRSDIDVAVRWRAVEMLRLYPQPRARAALAEFLDDPDPLVAWGAARSLAESHDRRALAALVEMLGDRSRPGGPPWYPARSDAFLPLWKHFPDDPAAEAAIRACLEGDDPDLREGAARALKEVEAHRAGLAWPGGPPRK